MSLLNDASLVFIPSGYKEDKVYSVIPSNGAGDLDFVRGCDATRINPQALVENTPWNIITYSQDFTNSAWTKINSVITANSTIAPDGTNTATKFESSASGSVQLIQSYAGTNTLSIYAKAGNISSLRIWIGSDVIFDLNNGTVTSGVATMENAGNGWYRCIISSTNSGAFNPYFIASASGQYVYIWGTQVNIGSTAKPYFPTTDRLNVPRLTYSPTLIERQSTNLVLWSQDFTDAVWGKSSSGTGTNPNVTSNNAIAPDGTLSADTIVFNSGAGTTASDQSLIYQSITLNAGTYTGSFYARVTSGTGQLMYRHAGGGSYTVANITTTWQRFSSTEISAGGSYSFQLTIRRDVNEPINSSITVEIWGAQLETGSLTSYIPTTSTAVTRVASYNSGCPSLLLEKQSTNLFTYSEQFDNVSWIKSSTTITSNTTISPSGLQDADTAVFGSNGQTYKQIILNAINTFSIYVKKGTNQYFSIQLETNSVAYRAIYDLDTTTVTFTGTNTSALITDVGNGWFRVSVVNTTSDAILYATIQAASSGTSVSGGSGTFYIWGAQLEASSYPTSYIPTTSATVTRLADSCSKTGISSLIGQTEGTMFLDTYFFNNNTTQVLLSLHDSADNKRLEIWSDNSTINGFIGGSVNVAIGNTTLTNGRHKLAVAYKSGNSAFYVDGVQIGVSSTSFTIAALTSLIYSYWSGIYKGEQSVNEVLLFKRRLTNTELANLTTL